MGWFDEQIKQRKLSDQEILEDSFMQAASVVLGKRVINDDKMSRVAIDDIFKYYHYKLTDEVEGIDEFEDYLDYVLRPRGIMRRNVVLKEKWYEDAYGPMLGFLKENEIPVALLPRSFVGYYYKDPVSGKKIDINRKNVDTISDKAICFYRPLPLKELSISDLLLYLKDCITTEDIVMMSFAAICVSLVGLIMPRLTRALTGPVLASKNLSMLLAIAVFMVCASLSSMLISTANTLISGRVSSKTSLAVEAAVMARVLSLPANFFRRFSSGELASRAGSVSSLCNMLLSFVFSLGLTSLSSLLYIRQIFSFAPALVVPSLLILAVTITVTTISSSMQIKISGEQMKLGAEGSGLSYALISGIQKIKLSGAEKRGYSKWLDHYSKEAQYLYNPPFFLKISSVIISAVSLVGNILLYSLAVSTGISQSDYFAFTAAYGMVSSAISSLAMMALSFARVRPVLDMAEPILKEVPEMSENKEIIRNLNGSIELNNVSFRYDEKSPYVVDNLSLKIKPGEYVAIVGKTGCGKSTLMRLLLGFEKPVKGAIYYDNKDITTLDLRSLRRKIGTVMQSGELFSGSIYENIAISAPSLTLDEAWEVAETAGMAEDIRNMPMGMQTMISEGQGGVSGGQKQRIMIARAIAPKPSILMFDEATSALDNKTQKHISDSLDSLKCTRIVIAHRLSTIKHCDRILVLDQGKIIEEGTYEELVAQNGFFAELVERQRLDKDN